MFIIYHQFRSYRHRQPSKPSVGRSNRSWDAILINDKRHVYQVIGRFLFCLKEKTIRTYLYFRGRDGVGFLKS